MFLRLPLHIYMPNDVRSLLTIAGDVIKIVYGDSTHNRVGKLDPLRFHGNELIVAFACAKMVQLRHI